MIVILDYGVGNLFSIKNMFKYLGFDALISSKLEDIRNASKLVLPGVGSFDTGMKNLVKNDFVKELNSKVLVEKTPILGICLGMQLMTNGSEEGVEKGLGWINAETIKFKPKNSLQFKVPHMGWNDVQFEKESSLLSKMTSNDIRFYFVHSFYVSLNDKTDELLTSSYENRFTAAFQKENILGVQFHPEKSHKFGKELLFNFLSNF